MDDSGKFSVICPHSLNICDCSAVTFKLWEVSSSYILSLSQEESKGTPYIKTKTLLWLKEKFPRVKGWTFKNVDWIYFKDFSVLSESLNLKTNKTDRTLEVPI